jgi:hypothetical protein
VLTKPDRDAVRTSVAASPAGGDAPGAAVDAPAPPAGAAGSFDLPATSPAAVAPPAGPVPAPPARAIGASDSPRALGIGADRTSDRGRPIVRVVFVLLALAAVALWMAAGHHSTRGEIADG